MSLRRTDLAIGDCRFCQGSGTVSEEHDPGAVEQLACQACEGTGKLWKCCSCGHIGPTYTGGCAYCGRAALVPEKVTINDD